MIDKRFQHLVFAFFMSLLMSCLMSLVISIFNIGLVDDILTIWVKAWSFAFIVAFPAIILVSPMVKRLVALAIKND